MHMRNCWKLLALSLVGSFIMAQSLDLAGSVVISGSSDPLPGATVTVKGTTISTVTDGDGKFRVSVNASQATLEVGFVGFKTVSLNFTASDTNIKVEMKQAPLEVLEEVVVTGFATSVKRQNLANSVASINAEELERAPAQTLDGMLSGKFSGVQVSQNTGAPGGGISVKLRGTSSINGNSQPLYVVDGVIVSNAEIQSGVNAVTAAAAAGSRNPQDQPSNRTADLIPSDIESIEVLKGPSAAAIYGAKASNGVIIITTKQGRAGQTVYDFSQTFGQRSIIKKIGTRRFTAETAFATYGQVGLDLFNAGGGQYIDYEEEMYGNTGDIFDTTFSARGGNEKTTFLFSGSALNDEGIIKRTGYDKYSLRLNLDHHINERLTVGLNTNFVRSVSDRGLTGNDNTGATFGVTLAFTPSFIEQRPDENGVYPSNPFNSANAIQTRDLMQNRETVNRSIISGKLDYNIFQSATQTLDFNMTAGVDYFTLNTDARFPRALYFEAGSGQPGTTVQGETESRNQNLYFNLTHTLFTVGGHTFRTTAGLQFEDLDLNYLNIVGNDLIEGQFNVDQAASIAAQQQRTLQRDRGFFVQEEVNLGEAIFFTLGVRGDSSSTNGDETKYYTYPKSSVSVRLSEYDFWSGLKDSISEFKLRAAWGQTGNLPLPYAKFSSFVSVNIDGSGGLVPGTLRGNPNIKPETSEEIEVGFDATFWDSRGTVEFSYFDQKITDLLLFRSLEPSSGFTQEAINAGEMEAKGMELAIHLNPVQTANWGWTTGLNYYRIRQKVVDLPDEVPAYTTGGFADFLGRYLIKEGFSPTTIIGAERDANGDYVALGDETPDFQIGWDSVVSYKNFSVSWLLDWKEGGDVINLTKLLTDLGGTTADLDEPGASSRLENLGSETTQFIEDGGYIRLREIKLEYEMGRNFLKDIVYGKLTYMRFALSGRNLWTDTDYSSYDPEVSNFGSVSIGRSVEVTPFPTSKSVYFTISLGL
ncbi:MAG: SusC/RagA family TonB-linked outer membrane protein [Acidobacteria bacterium]|nr:SusC/RagA family TonB-linked outer membrane protein [Acidobacteriota bacterium]